jgi:FixJ family two-component response regulator
MTDSRPEAGETEPLVFVIDDDASVRRSVSRLLRSAGFACEEMVSAEAFLEREHYAGTGCIILDVQMPGLSGMDLQNELNKADYVMPIIFVTGHGEIPMSVQAMKKGAFDFLTKPFDDEELLEIVSKAIEADRKAKAESDEIQRIHKLTQQLTPREFEVFRYVISGMLNKQIAYALKIAEKTVKVHRGRVMEKLNTNSLADLIYLAEKAGVGKAG